MYACQSEFTLYSCLNVKEHLTRNRRDIWSLSDSNRIRTHNHLVRKRIPNNLAKLASLSKWLSVRLRSKWLWVRIPLLSLKLSSDTKSAFEVNNNESKPSRQVRVQGLKIKIIDHQNEINWRRFDVLIVNLVDTTT